MTCILGRDGAKPHPRITHFDDKVMGLIHTIKGFEVAASNAALSGELNDVLLALNSAAGAFRPRCGAAGQRDDPGA